MFGGDCCDEEKESATRNRVFQTYIDQSVSTRGIVRNMTAKDMPEFDSDQANKMPLAP